MVEGVGRSTIHDVQKRLEKAGILKELEHGNINEVLQRLPETVSAEDVKSFLKAQNITFRRNIEQPDPVRSGEAEVPPPMPIDFPQYDSGSALDSADVSYMKRVLKGMKVAGITKGVAAKEAGAGEESPMTATELEDMAESAIQEAEDLNREILNSIAMRQFEAEYEKRHEEILEELSRILALAKSGKVDISFVILALTKMKVSEEGHIFARMGREATNINEEMNRATEKLYADGSVPSYADTQIAAQETRSMAFNLQQVTSTMQSVMNKIDGSITFCDQTIKYINAVKREMINRWGH